MDHLLDMTPEIQDNLFISLSNLAVLKLFHQCGINVKNYSDYRVNIEYNQDEGPYITESGFTTLFESECNIVSWYSSESEEEKQIMQSLVDRGYIKYHPEFCFFIPLKKYNPYLKKKENQEEIQRMISRLNKQNEHYTFVYLPEKDLLLIVMDYEGDFHLIVKDVLTIWTELEKINGKLGNHIHV
jgi:hypothetical protein